MQNRVATRRRTNPMARNTSKKLGGSTSRAAGTGGTDSYSVKATQTSVDYNPNKRAEQPGASGPHKVQSNASGKTVAPTPGYSPASIVTSCDYSPHDRNEKPGGTGPRLGSKKRAHY